jgi:carnitine monooxygenase subunit
MMLEKHDWDNLAKRLLDNVEKGARELYETSYEMPVSYYADETRWKREVDLIFKRKPLILAFGCELAEPNSYRAMTRLGVPLLLTRDKHGEVHGFINICRHRGAHITGNAEACGVARQFVCPYHAWTYDNKGALIGVPGKSHFGEIPEEYRRLVPISVEERGGFIWGVLTPGVEMNLEAHLGDMLPMIEQVGVDQFHYAGSRTLRGPNWKIALDGYIESYHFNVLHKNTFGAIVSDDYSIYDEVGPHTRYVVPSPQLAKLRDIPESEWKASNFMMFAFNIFPQISMGLDPREDPRDQVFTMAQVWPGDAPGSSVTHLSYATPRPLTSDKEREAMSRYMDLNADIIEREDYWVGRAIQSGLPSMLGHKFIYGRMERMVQNFEKSVNAIIEQAVG